MSKDHFQKVLEVIYRAKALGSKTLSNGAQLIGHVPHVAPEAWFHEIFPTLRPSDITQLEIEVLNQKIPEEYRIFLCDCSNGLGLFSGSLSLYGLRSNYVRTGDSVWQPFAIETPNQSGRPRDATRSAFFFGGYRWDGSRLYIEEGRVFRCAPPSAKPLNEWSDFWTMLNSEVARLSTLFNEKGQKKNPKIPTIPGAQANL